MRLNTFFVLLIFVSSLNITFAMDNTQTIPHTKTYALVAKFFMPSALTLKNIKKALEQELVKLTSMYNDVVLNKANEQENINKNEITTNLTQTIKQLEEYGSQIEQIDSALAKNIGTGSFTKSKEAIQRIKFLAKSSPEEVTNLKNQCLELAYTLQKLLA